MTIKLIPTQNSLRQPTRRAMMDLLADTADPFTEVSRGVDKLLWFVETHMQAKE